MLNRFTLYYQKHNLFAKKDKILLAVSGGMDSMTMLHLFKQHKLNIGVAHCNFKLRNEDAELDEQFVREFCRSNNIDFYSKAFSTHDYATEHGISIQMAARYLRYKWFEEIRIENNFQHIATAHHKNDVAETMLINLTKGTGLAGLHGIQVKNGKIIRPMLCFSITDINEYAKENNIDFREDVSNLDIKYTRNLIRHQIIPELEKVNPALIETLNKEAARFLNDEQLINQRVIEEKKRLFMPENNGFKIAIKSLENLNPLNSYLFYFLRDYGFNESDIADIIRSLNNNSGKTFNSVTHQIVKDREFLLLNELTKKSSKKIKIKSVKDFPFDCRITVITDDFRMENSNQYAYLDADKITYPVELRNWVDGDSFQPFGMKGNKKVSDFLIDNKISVFDKEKVKVLVSNNQIFWLVGHRIDDKFKITASTKEVVILTAKD